MTVKEFLEHVEEEEFNKIFLIDDVTNTIMGSVNEVDDFFIRNNNIVTITYRPFDNKNYMGEGIYIYVDDYH